jgi:hypothetical protein
MDVVGYLYVDHELDANGQPTVPVRRLLVTPHALFEAGERVQGVLGDVITTPNITFMRDTIYNHQARGEPTT